MLSLTSLCVSLSWSTQPLHNTGYPCVTLKASVLPLRHPLHGLCVSLAGLHPSCWPLRCLIQICLSDVCILGLGSKHPLPICPSLALQAHSKIYQQTAPQNFDLAQVLLLCVYSPTDPKPSFNTFLVEQSTTVI